MAEASARRAEPEVACWLEAQGRLLHPHTVMLRFVAVLATLGALQLGRGEGYAFGIGLLWHGQLYQLLVLYRVRQVVLGLIAGDGRLRPGWVDVPWVLRGAPAHTLRYFSTVGVILGVLYINPRSGILPLVVLLLLTEGAGLMLGRVIDPLIQVEVDRRVAIRMGFRPKDGSDRGDYR